MSALELDAVVHAYDGVPALRGVSLAVGPGELVCLVGPSGCGKTTLLRVAAGLERPAAGAVRVAGRLVEGERVHVPPEKRGIGMVFQDYALFPHLDVARNVAYGLRRRRRAERARRVAEMLALVGLEERAARHPHELSGGEQQRVALARALAPAPSILLLDEPFSSLDATERGRVREETRAILRASGAAAVLVTHDGEEALQLGERVCVLRAGAVEQIGTPSDVYFRPAGVFVATFFGDANVLDATVADGAAHTPLGALALDPPPAFQGPALAVVRHEALRVARADGSGVEARIVDTRLAGGRRLTRLRLADGACVDVRHPAVDAAEPGTSVRVELCAPRLVHVFPR